MAAKPKSVKGKTRLKRGGRKKSLKERVGANFTIDEQGVVTINNLRVRKRVYNWLKHGLTVRFFVQAPPEGGSPTGQDPPPDQMCPC